ncbi:hypothetical protein LCGC14_2440750 [marine sediment metagenome]|uniref:Uncharacterized protein n=1 Tax=marine sediment metagenome TaxID=412755 RepID=A0A0F9BJ36_9ZZZZ
MAVYQGAPLTPVIDSGTQLDATSANMFTFAKQVGFVVIQNESATDLYVKWDATTAAPAASASWCDGMIPAGETRPFEIRCNKLALYNPGGGAVVWTDDATPNKELWITGWVAE